MHSPRSGSARSDTDPSSRDSEEGMMATIAAPEHAQPQALTAASWRALIASFLGWMFDGYETYALILVAGVALRQLLPPDQLASIPIYIGGLLAVTLVGWATGGIIAGVLADYIGRKRMLMLSILWYALFTGLTAFAASYTSLLILRFLTGLGLGAEWGPASGAPASGERGAGQSGRSDPGRVHRQADPGDPRPSAAPAPPARPVALHDRGVVGGVDVDSVLRRAARVSGRRRCAALGCPGRALLQPRGHPRLFRLRRARRPLGPEAHDAALLRGRGRPRPRAVPRGAGPFRLSGHGRRERILHARPVRMDAGVSAGAVSDGRARIGDLSGVRRHPLSRGRLP